MRKILLIKVFLIWSVPLALAQLQVSGTVTDANNESLPGASILIQGTTIGTTTDFEGNYTLEVADADAVLVFSFIGYTSQTVPVGNHARIDVQLVADMTTLDEVVVTALGVRREVKSLAYARQSVNTDDMVEARSTNFINSLSGAAAGVQVTNGDTPTGSNRVIIRGVTSLTGDNQPLFVVDGISLENPAGEDGDLDYGNPISHINASDIENIEILKGPNAAALYGSRASNGVILITTKSGKSTNGIGVTINSNTMFMKTLQYPDYQYVYGTGQGGRTASGVKQLDPETGLAMLGSRPRAYGAPMLGYDVLLYDGSVGQYVAYPNNIKELYQTGAVFTNSVSLNKASEHSSFRLSYTNTNSDYTLRGFENQQRHNLTLRATTQFAKSLIAETTVLYTNDRVTNRLYQNQSPRNPANNYIYMHPSMSVANLTPYKDENGYAFNYEGPFDNPLWNLYENSNQDESNHLIGSVGVTLNITDDLSLRTKAMTNLNLVEGAEFNNMGAAWDTDGHYRAINRKNNSWNYESVLSYDKIFNKFSLVGLLGGNIYDLQVSNRYSTINSLLFPDVQSLNNTSTVALVNEVDQVKRVSSLFASASAGYNEVVYLNLTARNDRSSSLPLKHNSYFYPSVGTSFVFTELIASNPWLSFGKLRASWAQVGSDASPYQVNTVYNYGGNYNGIAWIYLDPTRKNADLKPEITTSSEVGLEARLLRNRVSLNATYYTSSSVNQIVTAQVTPTTGFNNKVYNAGEIQSSGWEFFVSSRVIDAAFKWDVEVNWSKNESMVVSLKDGIDRFLLNRSADLSVYAEVGKPFGVIRGNKWLTDADGNKLVNQDGRIMYESDVVLGNAQPDWIGGLRNSFRYKGFNLGFLVDVKRGGDLYSGSIVRTMWTGTHVETLYGRDDYFFSQVILGENADELKGEGLYGNPYSDDRVKGAIYDDAYVGVIDEETGAWVAGEKNTHYISSQNYFGDAANDQARVIYDASFIKLREVILGYTLPEKVLSATPFTTARVSLVGRNLVILYQNTPRGLDPEAGTTSGNGQGIEFGSFLPTASYGFNVQLSF